MRILYFSPRDCWPLTTGARVRDYNLARQLARHADVTYLGFASDKAQRVVVRAPAGNDGEIDQITVPRFGGYSPLNVLRGFTGPIPISVLNYTTAAMREELGRILRSSKWDLVQIEGVHLHSYLSLIRQISPATRIVSDWHNVESELMSRFAENSATPFLKRVYARRTATLLTRLEERLLEDCDAHLVCSRRERDILCARHPQAQIEVVGNGVDVSFYSNPASPVPRTHNLVFVGSMDYHANIDGALYFAREIWPLLRKALPDLRFTIVGSRPTPEITALSKLPGIVVTGTVPDVRPYYQSASAVVVPLRVGSGTRLKVLEAMSAGVPAISTRLGAEGIDFTDGRDLLAADTPEEFSQAVLRVLGSEETSRRLAEAGRELVRTKYDWDIIGSRLFDFYAQPARDR